MNAEIETVTPQRAIEISSGDSRAIILDVRTPSEFSARRAVGARNIPLDSLDSSTASLPRDGKLLLLCEKGGRAALAAARLRDQGFTDLHVVEGGTEAWAKEGLPVEGSGRKVISIERQVRIGAGSLVLGGAILGYLVNPGFYVLPAFVGAGLVFAGVTDWCGMGLLLARAPWNR